MGANEDETPTGFEVLVVEDEPLVRLAVQLVFDDDPRFRITGVAASAEEALAVARAAGGGFDLIILDNNIQGATTGLEVAATLRATCDRSRIILRGPPRVLKDRRLLPRRPRGRPATTAATRRPATMLRRRRSAEPSAPRGALSSPTPGRLATS